MNYQERLLKQDINFSTLGDNKVITINVGEMPAAWENSAVYIAIDYLNLVTSGATTLQLKDGASDDANVATFPQANYGGAYVFGGAAGISIENNLHNEHGIITLGPNHSFVINSTNAVQVGGFIRYRLLATN